MIALGEGQGTFLHVCIAKKTCEKHWGKPTASKDSIPTEAEIEADAAHKRQEAAWARQRAAEERWKNELRAHALQLIASKTAKLAWSKILFTALLDELNVDATFNDLVGRTTGLPTRRYPQATAVALALRHSWRREDLVKFARRLGVKLTAKDLSDLPKPTIRTDESDVNTIETSEKSVH